MTGHAHRNGIYQVAGDRVKLTQWGNEDRWDPQRPIFVNTVLAGPLGFDNETGRSKESNGLGHRYLVKPGYRVILFGASGRVERLERVESTQVAVRASVNWEFKQ